MKQRNAGNTQRGTRQARVKPSATFSTTKTGITCEVCGNDYDKPMEIVVNGISHYFDSFECAIHALAPRCDHCGCRIIGHGMEAGGTMFCCAHCANQKGVEVVRDRA